MCPHDPAPLRWRSGAAPAWLAGAAVTLTAFYLWSYRESLRGFFVLDDYWVMFAASRIHVRSPLDLVQFVVPVPDFSLYRPLSTVGYFYLLRQAWGYDPFWYHATHLAFHVVNAVLAYAIASRLLRSRAAGLATALTYACAPGHAFAVSWLALFTVTGTAFLYFVALWTWTGSAGRTRVPLTLVLFCLALTASEHAVSFPIVLSLVALLIDRRREWRSVVREEAPFYAVALVYCCVRLYYMFVIYPTRVTPMQLAYFKFAYGIDASVPAVLHQLGRYLGYSLNVLYEVPAAGHAALVIGLLVCGLAAGTTIAVLSGLWTARPLRVAAFGTDLFIVGLGPILLLPRHVNSCYVSIGALGVALAVVGLAAALPRVRRVAPWVVVLALVGTHVFSTVRRLNVSEEVSFVRNYGNWAANWLYTVAAAARRNPEEIVLPRDGVTGQLFGEAHRLLLCASYEVRLEPNIYRVPNAPGRVIVRRPSRLPDAVRADWRQLIRPCPANHPPP